MTRESLPRNVALFVLGGLWLFMLLALGSFHPTDWPSHAVEPAPATQNLCGNVGAMIAYYSFLAVGQGVFPVLFFTGVCLGMLAYQGKVGDLWMRAIGLVLLAAAFAAIVHHFKPGSYDGMPEGSGGYIGIGAAHFLQHYFSIWGTRLILLMSMLVGLLLAADDLVLRAPGVVNSAFVIAKQRAPQINWNFVTLPKLPALPRFVTREAAAAKAVRDLKAAAKPKKQSGAEQDGSAGPVAGAKKATPLSPIEIIDPDDPTRQPILLSKKSGKASTEESVVAAQAIAEVNADRLGDDEDRDDRDVIGSVAATTPKAISASYDDDEHLENDVIDLSYREDEPAAAAGDGAHLDEADPQPSESAVIPPPEEQKPPMSAPEIRKDIIVKLPSIMKPRQIAPPPPKELGEYTLPPWDCLAEPEHGYSEIQEKFVREKAAVLEQALREFSIDAQVVEIDTGPVITMYEINLAPGVKVSTISALTNDIQRALKAETVRIVAPIPGKNTVGIEVPNEQKEKVRMKELMQLAPDSMHKMAIPLFLGKDASGEPLIEDLTKMPHCLIAGTTGSGKSVCINTIIMSIMYLQRPDVVKLILVDPKVVEMAPFKDIPHLMCPVINDSGRATSVLEWACTKMDERYEFLAEAGVRNLKGYNDMTQEELIEKFQPSTPEEEARIPKKLPYIVIIVDELADLMMTSGKEVESHIVRLAQKARAVGIHLVLATQRPQATVVTGLIKANMPSKIAFRVSSKMDSRIVLDQNGAEVLLGQGDMLYLAPGASKPVRSQGTFIDDREIRDSVKNVKELAEAQYEPELVQIKAAGNVDEEAAKDELFEDAVRVVLETKRGSVSLLQRRLTIGYSRASRLIEAMASSGILGNYKGSQAREVNITVEEWEAMRAQMNQDQAEGMSV
ncbi:MAG TPA: DNA translocase FtsK 4TM domain-containing protein [Tepidisphaeraceae bacterium]|jgi:S-DNA-T family DNA segregation ATPase FtsK/SpoIIIE|nr:DNA translocase FtsK 4TM domain-containing protein [Tepidisphaeraceae bacterium]